MSFADRSAPCHLVMPVPYLPINCCRHLLRVHITHLPTAFLVHFPNHGLSHQYMHIIWVTPELQRVGQIWRFCWLSTCGWHQLTLELIQCHMASKVHSEPLTCHKSVVNLTTIPSRRSCSLLRHHWKTHKTIVSWSTMYMEAAELIYSATSSSRMVDLNLLLLWPSQALINCTPYSRNDELNRHGAALFHRKRKHISHRTGVHCPFRR